MLYVATVIWFNHSLIQPSSAWVQEIVILLKSSVITELFSGKGGGGGKGLSAFGSAEVLDFDQKL